jgi:hypothetical protein
MTFKEKLLTAFGDIWYSGKSVALWPYPALVLSWPRVRLTWDDYRYVTGLMQPGDMILTREDAFLFSNLAIPGQHKHLAVYVGAVRGEYIRKSRRIKITETPHARVYRRAIVHAISDGVICQDAGDLFFDCDRMTVVRPWRTHEQQCSIVATALRQLGKSYDFDFDKDSIKRLYCTEVGSVCCREAGIELPETMLVPRNPLALLFKRPGWMKEAYVADKFVHKYPVVCAVGKRD